MKKFICIGSWQEPNGKFYSIRVEILQPEYETLSEEGQRHFKESVKYQQDQIQRIKDIADIEKINPKK